MASVSPYGHYSSCSSYGPYGPCGSYLDLLLDIGSICAVFLLRSDFSNYALYSVARQVIPDRFMVDRLDVQEVAAWSLEAL